MPMSSDSSSLLLSPPPPYFFLKVQGVGYTRLDPFLERRCVSLFIIFFPE